LKEAEAEYRAALRLKPDYPDAHYNLGIALGGQGRLEEAEAEFRAALRLKADYPQAHNNLGTALGDKGQLDEAIAEYRAALRLKPDYPHAHCNLGQALKRQGRFEEALACLRRGHELGHKQPGWRLPSAQWVCDAERLVALDKKLPAILRRQARPADAAEQLALADLCTIKKRYAAAARFYADAFAADPKLADGPPLDPRYWAACSAVLLAGRGPGEEAAKLRRQALAWLRADLSRKARAPQGGTPQERGRLQEALRYWQAAPDLAGVRDAGALAALPAEERAAWQQLWAEVAAVAAKARDGK
jgi:tetratricopeptide (TPR) repeat protein